MPETKTIDITPTWSALAPVFIDVAKNENAPVESRLEAEANIRNIAGLADKYVELVNEPKTAAEAADKLEHAIALLWKQYEAAKGFLPSTDYVEGYIDGWRNHHSNDTTQVMRDAVIKELRNPTQDDYEDPYL